MIFFCWRRVVILFCKIMQDWWSAVRWDMPIVCWNQLIIACKSQLKFSGVFQPFVKHSYYWKLHYINIKFKNCVENKTNIEVYHFLVILVYFTIMYALDVIYSMASKWRKYCVITCYWVSLPKSTFSDFILVVWIWSGWGCLQHRNKKCYKSGLDLLFCWMSGCRETMEKMLMQDYPSRYVLFVAVTLWLA